MTEAAGLFYSCVEENLREARRNLERAAEDARDISGLAHAVAALREKALLIEAIVDRLDEYVDLIKDCASRKHESVPR